MSGERQSDETEHLIDPWQFWAEEEEDDEGNLVEGSETLYLMEIVSPEDGTVWVSRSYAPLIMFRRDVLDLKTRPPTDWLLIHRPLEWNALSEKPCAVPTRARFLGRLVNPLLNVPRVRVLPLTDDPQAKPMAHAIVRGEDVIGYVMSTLTDSPQLPEALQVPDRRRGQPTTTTSPREGNDE